MSSILIKGMEMPKDKAVAVVIHPDGTAYSAKMFAGVCTEYLADCTAVPVPPHGRSIDADVLADVFRGFIAMYDSCPFSQLAPTDKARRDELQAALAEVINAPTIIEAEEEVTGPS